MRVRSAAIGISGGVTALALLASVPVDAAATRGLRRAAPTLSAPGSLGSFTPAAADPRMAASFARNGFAGGFRFTPSAAPGTRRSVTVAVRARQQGRTTAERTASAAVPAALAPTAYNLGVAVGWKRFALSGDVARVDAGLLPGSREAMDVGLSYGGNKWRTRLQFGADRSVGEQPLLVGNDEAYSVDLGGSYTLTRNLEVTGGLRYRTQRDRLESFADTKRDSQAVYVGTAFKF